MKMITGNLKYWRKVPWGPHEVYQGVIFNDIKNRFKDGRTIQTSPVVREEDKGTYFLVFTENSIYLCYKNDQMRGEDGTSGNMLGP
jgi:hypothetical protein